MAGLYDDLLDSVMEPERPMTFGQIAAALGRGGRPRRWPPVNLALLHRALSGQRRFVYLGGGLWVRRSDGPDAGVRSRLPTLPFADGAAAQAVPPLPPAHLDVIGGSGGRATTTTTF